ncbi:hypothetical protein HPB48_012217 [Haemaphysalis longicornis]|uniref:Orn/DAP/Arg decarboxylase 2 N-terminal domain-containing protein n=1 Tax=Haemaphysalis longicornis TaxID=44386 RepID=A0A9J6FXD3_HAELO|nr:hypothetical protein HPB48_012217 [Haemaphysalis longicornis]
MIFMGSNVDARYKNAFSPFSTFSTVSFCFMLLFFIILQREIQAVLSTGSLSNRIIFGNPAKEVSHLDFARKVGVTLMTFDCVEELHKILDKNAR